MSVFGELPTHMYWEGHRGPLETLCLESIERHSSNLIMHDSSMLPAKCNKLRIEQRADFARLIVLREHGGLYVDSDVVFIRPPTFVGKLDDYEVVGFHNGRGVFPNGCFAVRPGSAIINKALDHAWHRLKRGGPFRYNEFGARTLTSLVRQHKDQVLQLPKRLMFRHAHTNLPQIKVFKRKANDIWHTVFNPNWVWDAYGYHLMQHVTRHWKNASRTELLNNNTFLSHVLRCSCGQVRKPQRSKEIIKRLPLGGHFIEIGVRRGANASTVLQARPDVTATLIDPYAEYIDVIENPRKEHHRTSANCEKLYAEMKAKFVGRARGGVDLIRLSSVMAAAVYNGRRPDVVFIDANHDEGPCFNDCEAWYRHVPLGGWIGGHDHWHRHPGVERAVRRVFGEDITLGADLTWWHQKKTA